MLRHHTYILLSSLVLLFNHLHLLAQDNQATATALSIIEGEVRSESGRLESATVFLDGTSVHTSTDSKGYFRLQARPGRYTLVVRLVGYKPYRKAIDLKAGEAQPPQSIYLHYGKQHQLGEVVSWGKRRRGQAYAKGFPMQVVETQRLALQSLQTSELLERLPGVKVRQDGGLGSRANYNINGFSGSSVRIFIDGNPAENFGQAFSINSLPPALIERIEVFKGVLPAYLSGDALGGAINIVLKEQRRNALQTSYSYGSFDTHQWNVSGSLHTKQGFFVEGTAFYNYSANNYKVWGRNIERKYYDGRIERLPYARRFNDAYRSYGGRVALGLERRPWADKLSLSATLSSAYKEMQHGVTMENVYGDRHTRRSSAILGLDYHKRDFLLTGLDLSLHGSYSFLTRQLVDTVGIQHSWGGIIYDANGIPMRYASGAEASGRRKTLAKNLDGTLLLKARLGYRIDERSGLVANALFNSFAREEEDPLENPLLVQLKDIRDLSKSILSLSYERRDFAGHLTSTAFVKHYSVKALAHTHQLNGLGGVERNTLSKRMNGLGYGFTLAYQLTPRLQLQLSGEQAMRMPEPRELFGDIANNLDPSTNLEPEKSFNLNLGATYRHSWGGVHHLTANALLLYRNTRGMIREDFELSAGRNEFSSFRNLDNVLSYGIDTELSYNYDYRFEVKLSLSKLSALFNTRYDAKGAPYNYYRMHLRNEPSLKINGQISYTQPNFIQRGGRGSIYLGMNFVEKFYRDWSNVGSQNLAIIPRQFVLDAGVSYAFPKHRLTLSLDAKNLLNRQVFDNYGLQKPGFALFGKISYRIF